MPARTVKCLFASAFAVAALVRCSGGGGSSTSFIPDVWVECSTAQVSQCSGTGLSVWIGMTSTLSASCENTLVSLSASQRRLSFTATGSAVSTRKGIYLFASVTNWVSTTGATIDVLDPGTYKACSFVDTNGNDLLDTNEPVGSADIVVGQTNEPVSNWKPAFN
jgi:hypothetical protein